MATAAANGRWSWINFAMPTTIAWFNSGNGVNARDRAHFLHLYRGINLAPPGGVVEIIYVHNMGAHGILASKGNHIGRGL